MTRPAYKTALITGGAKRIGQAIAEDLAANGWAVAVHCHQSLREGEALCEKIRSAGGKALALRADLADLDAVERLLPQAQAALGPIDLLVNNASVFETDTAESMSRESFALHHRINLQAPLFLAQAFAANLPAGASGNIVNLIDQRVLKLSPEFFSYQLSKSALWVATRTLAQALAPFIRVNAISPGPTLKNARQEPQDFQAQIDALVLKRGPALSEFGHTVRYLVATPSLTGQMICLDGGQHLAWETPDIAGIPE